MAKLEERMEQLEKDFEELKAENKKLKAKLAKIKDIESDTQELSTKVGSNENRLNLVVSNLEEVQKAVRNIVSNSNNPATR